MTLYEEDQMRLDHYIRKSHSKEEIGRFYERYIGYLYEKEKYLVTYEGIREGFEDLGRDLIAKNKKEILIIQCKNWSKDSMVHEKHIYQLFGTATHFQNEHSDYVIKPIFISTTELSELAQKAAHALKIETRIIPLRKDYPMVKCNINRHGKLYHLPCDDAHTYDNIQITENTGEAFVHTIAEALALGFDSPTFRKKRAA